jgi:RNA recognition motif-containing protein
VVPRFHVKKTLERQASTATRLILRNLRFDVGEADVRKVLVEVAAAAAAAAAGAQPAAAEAGSDDEGKEKKAEQAPKEADAAKEAGAKPSGKKGGKKGKQQAEAAAAAAAAAEAEAAAAAEAEQAEFTFSTTAASLPSLLTHIHLPTTAAPTALAAAAVATAGDDDEQTTAAAAAALNDLGEAARRRAFGRGFGFLQFATRRDAAVAIAALNEKPVRGRLMAVDWAVQPEAYAEAEAAATAEAEAAAPEAEEDAEDEADGEDGSDDDSGSDSGSENSGSDEEDEDEDDDEDDEEDGSDVELDEAELAGLVGDEHDTGIAPEPEEAESAPAARPQAESRNTLFVRNLVWEADDAALFRAFAPFGPLLYARVVKDSLTGRSKGSGFVAFKTPEAADRALEAAGAGSSAPSATHRPSDVSAAITAALKDGGIRVQGRLLIVSRVVNKDEAAQLVDPKKRNTARFDRRHTYLSHEGNIRPESDAAKAMPESDLLKRESAAKEKKAKLTKSPFFFVSPVRLSVRNLSKSITDQELKRLGMHAAVEGIKSGLVGFDEGDPVLRGAYKGRGSSLAAIAEDAEQQAARAHGRSAPASTESKVTAPKVEILSARILREKDGDAAAAAAAAAAKGKGKGMNRASLRARVDADGKARSKGYGFIEFAHHHAALAALRQLNNNPLYARLAAGGNAALAEYKVPRHFGLHPHHLNGEGKVVVRQDAGAGGAEGVDSSKHSKKTIEVSALGLNAQSPSLHNAPRLIVEFAVEDVREVIKQEKKRAARTASSSGGKASRERHREKRDRALEEKTKTNKDAPRDRKVPRDRDADRKKKDGAGSKPERKGKDGAAAGAKATGAPAAAGAKRSRSDREGPSAVPRRGQREAEDVFDRVLAGGDREERRPAKKPRGPREARDDHDKLVNNYMSSLFAKSMTAAAGGGQKSDLMQWM